MYMSKLASTALNFYQNIRTEIVGPFAAPKHGCSNRLYKQHGMNTHVACSQHGQLTAIDPI